MMMMTLYLVKGKSGGEEGKKIEDVMSMWAFAWLPKLNNKFYSSFKRVCV